MTKLLTAIMMSVMFVTAFCDAAETLERSRFTRNSELYQVHHAANFGRVPVNRVMLVGHSERTGFNTRIQKVPKGWLVFWVHWNRAENKFYILMDAYSQDLQRVFQDGPRRLCSSQQLSARFTTCSPNDGDAAHLFFQLGDEVKHQTVLWGDDGVSVSGGWCGISEHPMTNNTLDIEVPPRTFEVLMSASCDTPDHTALAFKLSLPSQPPEVLLYNTEGGRTHITIDGAATGPLYSYPKIRETGEGLFAVVWEGEGHRHIVGRIIDGSGEFVTETFTVTEGMERSRFDSPEIVPDRFGAGFVVLFKEIPIEESSDIPRSLIWMRELDSFGVPAADNPDPHVIFSSYYTTSGLKPSGTATLDGMVWVSFVHENKLQGGLFDFYGVAYETWDAPFPSDLGFKNITEISQATHGDLNNGFMIAISGGPSRPISVVSIDRYDLRNSLNSLTVADYRQYWNDRNPNFTKWQGTLPHDPAHNWVQPDSPSDAPTDGY